MSLRRHIRVKFHFLSLTSGQVAELLQAIDASNLKIEAGKGLEGNDCVQVLSLNEQTCEKIAEFVSRQELPQSLYAVYSSIVSERDHDGLRLPAYAVKLIQEIGGYVDFAYISTS